MRTADEPHRSSHLTLNPSPHRSKTRDAERGKWTSAKRPYLQMSDKLFNPVLPSKVYGIYDGQKLLDEIRADNVHAAFAEGREKWGPACRAAIFLRVTGPNDVRVEPMFV